MGEELQYIYGKPRTLFTYTYPSIKVIILHTNKLLLIAHLNLNRQPKINLELSTSIKNTFCPIARLGTRS